MNNLITVVERVKPIMSNGEAIGYEPIPNPTYVAETMVEASGVRYITYPGVKPHMYLIDNMGRIYNANTHAQLSVFVTENKHCRVKLQTSKGGGQVFLLGRLVAYQFCVLPSNFERLQVEYINGDTMCNYAYNLRWPLNKPTIVDEKFVRKICAAMQEGKPNIQIIAELGLPNQPSSNCLMSDIRAGRTWRGVSKDYDINKSSIAKVYDDREIEIIKDLMLIGKDDMFIYNYMNGLLEYMQPDKSDPRYRYLHSIRYSVWGYQNLRGNKDAE